MNNINWWFFAFIGCLIGAMVTYVYAPLWCVPLWIPFAWRAIVRGERLSKRWEREAALARNRVHDLHHG